MTILVEDFTDIALDGVDVTVSFHGKPIRPAFAETGLVTPARVLVRAVDGKVTSPALDPGPCEVLIQTGRWKREYSIVIPDTGTHRLRDLLDAYEVPEPAVVSLVKVYRDEVVGSKDAAVLSAFHAQQSEQEAREWAEEAATTITGVVSIDGKQGVVTKAALGIDRLDNTRDADKPISTAVENRLSTIVDEVEGTFEDVATALATKQDAAQVQAIALAVATARIADIIGDAPDALDTVYELATAIGNDPNFRDTILNAIGLRALLTDPRFTDARTPLAHTHATAQVTGLDAALSAKVTRGATAWKLYGTAESGGSIVDELLDYSAVANAWQIAQRYDGGRLRVGAAVEAGDAVTKAQLDAKPSLGTTSTTALRGDAHRVVTTFPTTGDDGVLYMTVE